MTSPCPNKFTKFHDNWTDGIDTILPSRGKYINHFNISSDLDLRTVTLEFNRAYAIATESDCTMFDDYWTEDIDLNHAHKEGKAHK